VDGFWGSMNDLKYLEQMVHSKLDFMQKYASTEGLEPKITKIFEMLRNSLDLLENRELLIEGQHEDQVSFFNEKKCVKGNVM
jgi:hypothetical protein